MESIQCSPIGDIEVSQCDDLLSLMQEFHLDSSSDRLGWLLDVSDTFSGFIDSRVLG